MKKKNLATAMAAAMMFGGVAPVVAHADNKTNVVENTENVTPDKTQDIASKDNVVDVALANAQNVTVMPYSEVYNTQGTLTTSDDKLALNENQEILYSEGMIGNDLETTTASYLVATKMTEKEAEAQKDAIKNAETTAADYRANIETLKNLTYNKDGKTVKVYTEKVENEAIKNKDGQLERTRQTVTLTNDASDVNGFAPEVKFVFRNIKMDSKIEKPVEKLETFDQVLKGQFGVKDNTVTLNVAKKDGITGSNGLNKLAYELSKTYNSDNTDTKENYVYSGGKIINKTITIYEKGTQNKVGEIVLEGYNTFKENDFKYFVNIPEMKDLSSLDQPELSWAKQDVMNALYNAQLNGYEDHTLKLNDSVTRAEFAKMLVEIKGIDLDKKAEENFSDVNSSDWYYNYVATLAKEGIIKGDGNGTFRPNDTITRQEAAVMIAKAARISEKIDNRDVDRFNPVTGEAYDTKTNFKDDANIALWSDGSVYEMAKNNVIKGYEDKTFKPENKITRAESVVMISRIKGDTVNASNVTPEPIEVAGATK
ncbi:MAG: S-layer homology domain-containing protein [Romboutsia sp.]